MTSPLDTPGHFDASGCLSSAGLARLQQAPVGSVPPELAQHFSSCRRCQDRLLMLAAAAEGLQKGEIARLRRRVRWVAGVMVAVLLAVLLILTALVRQQTG